MVAERHDGGSMMEQLVPEIKTLAFSYLDHMSLCRLSMTNSAMRRTANDDGPWKALYRKDFTTEQDNVTPTNGWKSYYAATKAIVSINAEFYDIIKERSLQAMSRFWLDADYVKCIQGSGELFIGWMGRAAHRTAKIFLFPPYMHFPGSISSTSSNMSLTTKRQQCIRCQMRTSQEVTYSSIVQ